MKMFNTKIDCLMEDGEVLSAIADQRDYAAFEASDLYDADGGRPVQKIRWLAWNALRRAKLTTAAWPKFNTELCVQAQVQLDEEEQEEPGGDEDSLDPSREG